MASLRLEPPGPERPAHPQHPDAGGEVQGTGLCSFSFARCSGSESHTARDPVGSLLQGAICGGVGCNESPGLRFLTDGLRASPSKPHTCRAPQSKLGLAKSATNDVGEPGHHPSLGQELSHSGETAANPHEEENLLLLPQKRQETPRKPWRDPQSPRHRCLSDSTPARQGHAVLETPPSVINGFQLGLCRASPRPLPAPPAPRTGPAPLVTVPLPGKHAQVLGVLGCRHAEDGRPLVL